MKTFKDGGHVTEQRSDTIVAKLSEGEYRVPQHVIDKYGDALLRAINRSSVKSVSVRITVAGK